MSSITSSSVSLGSAGNKPTILLVGNSIESVKTIAATLESCYFEECQQINNCEIRFRHDSCPGMHLHKAFDAKIITKYYSASVIVQALVVEPSMALGEDMLESCEAVVCIHTAKNITDLEHTKRLLSVAKDHINTKIFALTYVNESEAKDELYRDSLSTWCFDNKVECVATDMNKLEDGRSNREKHGLARVYECLETTMWSNMERHGNRGKSSVGLLSLHNEKDSARKEQQEAPLPEGDKNTKNQQKVVEEVPLVLTAQDVETANKEVNDETKVLQETEELMGLIAKAKDIREASLNGTMSDAERYEQAEKTALRLAELFDLMGGEDLKEMIG